MFNAKANFTKIYTINELKCKTVIRLLKLYFRMGSAKDVFYNIKTLIFSNDFIIFQKNFAHKIHVILSMPFFS